MTPDPDDDFTELRDADIDRMDGVGKGANGTQWFIAKGANGPALFDPEFVRGLVGTTGPDATAEMLTPAQAMALVHAASVRKAADLDATAVLAEPDGTAPGNPDEPGSPAWEAVDAASARKWTGLLVRARNALCALADREGLEAATADPDDLAHALDLRDAACCIDSAVGILARFAVDEQAEADLAGEDAAAVGKAVAALDLTALETLEGLQPVIKAGRVLSSGNETAIRDAIAALQRVLASLPQPTTDDDGQPVATMKETSMPTATAPAADDVVKVALSTGTVELPGLDPAAVEALRPLLEALNAAGPVAKSSKKTKPGQDVAKAKGDAMLVVFNADGTAIGVCKPDAVMPIADGPATADDNTPPAPPVAPGEDAAVIPGTQTVAAPAPTAPEAPMAKQADTQTTAEQAKKKDKKSKKQARIAKALAELLTPPAEEHAPTAQLAAEVQVLKDRLAKLGQLPDDRKSPLLNGAGIPDGTAPAAKADDNADGLAHLRKAIDDAPAGPDRDEAHTAYALASLAQRFAR